MRVIKFRAWDNKDGRMYIGNEPFRGDTEKNIAVELDGSVVVEDHEEYYPSIMSYDYRAVAPFSETLVLMQFTGLLDKNGKEIYEGDLVRAHYPSLDTLETHQICQVVYAEPEFVMINGEGDDLSLGGEVEIVGNIYENPELLTV